MLGSDSAKTLWGEIKRINEAVKNNLDKFPERFGWKLTEYESKKTFGINKIEDKEYLTKILFSIN